MTFDAWFTLAVTIVAVAGLVTERFPPAVVMGGAVTVLLLAGVIEDADALQGFANDAPVTVAALYVLAGAASVTGALDGITARLLGDGSGRARTSLARLLLPLTAVSAFMPNTPLVGMMAPRVVSWCRRVGQSPSRFLMPLAYTTVLGGVITVIGTSTNLVVSGLLRDADMEPLGLFEITAVGLPIAIVGALLLVAVGPRLLPERIAPTDRLPEQIREYTVEMQVDPRGPIAGRTITDAGLRNLEGVFLFGVERDGELMTPVDSDLVLQDDDRLMFAGDITRVVDLHRMTGLRSVHEPHFPDERATPDQRFYEAVVGIGSPLVGATLRSSDFRARHGAAVLAIHRAGRRLEQKLGEVRLHPGDVLLLVGPRRLEWRWRDRPDFAVLAPVGGEQPLRRSKGWVVRVIALALIVAAGTGVVSLLQASLVAALALVATGAVTPREARASVDLNVILLMALSFGLGAAFDRSGLAATIADGMVAAFEPFGDIGLLAGILLATMIVTELLSNNAAAILMFPIGMAAAASAAIDPRPVAIVILLGASLSFLTPVGYQANMIVWSMGGYRYSDFPRLGAPLTVLVLITVPLLVPLVFPLR